MESREHREGMRQREDGKGRVVMRLGRYRVCRGCEEMPTIV